MRVGNLTYAGKTLETLHLSSVARTIRRWLIVHCLFAVTWVPVQYCALIRLGARGHQGWSKENNMTRVSWYFGAM